MINSKENLQHNKWNIVDFYYSLAKEKYSEKLHPTIKNRLEYEFAQIHTNGLQSGVEWLTQMTINLEPYTSTKVNQRFLSGSFLFYLCGLVDTNPLQPHYYCPHCKHIEFVNNEDISSGIDLINHTNLSAPTCPVCKRTMTGDGNNIPCDIVYDTFREKMERSFSNKLIFTNNRISRYIKIMEESTCIKASTIDIGSIDLEDFFTNDSLEGIPAQLFFSKELVAAYPPKKFSDIVWIMGIENGGYDLCTTTKPDSLYNDDLKEFVVFPEDILIFLMKHGVPYDDAFAIAKNTKDFRSEVTNRQMQLLRSKGISEKYITTLNKTIYLSTKGDATENAINLLRLVWYKINYPVHFYASILTSIIVPKEYFEIFLNLQHNDAKKAQQVLNSVCDELFEEHFAWSSDRREIALSIAIECFNKGIKFLPPDEHSNNHYKFVVEGNNIRLPFVCDFCC